ncbi:hypothetical protein E2C01_048024 [Portunus trituberculatus]|uniref:Uncharacterized protein n=1 Tax=Portunus trituberculatus TaxID=210409 RepID=A0A5B7G9I0_PORTR|nr:hypothetical protein [Portunus trituberculatus]
MWPFCSPTPLGPNAFLAINQTSDYFLPVVQPLTPQAPPSHYNPQHQHPHTCPPSTTTTAGTATKLHC